MKTFLISSALIASLLSGAAIADGMQMQMQHPQHDHNVRSAVKIDRTIAVDMTDNMRFTPQKISVRQGETVRFVVKNSGQVKHEMVIGSAAELKEHAEMMRKMSGMAHDDDNQVTLAPGASGELVQRFTVAGIVDFACLQPGHFEAGMKGAITVKQRS